MSTKCFDYFDRLFVPPICFVDTCIVAPVVYNRQQKLSCVHVVWTPPALEPQGFEPDREVLASYMYVPMHMYVRALCVYVYVCVCAARVRLRVRV